MLLRTIIYCRTNAYIVETIKRSVIPSVTECICLCHDYVKRT